jgi:murein DD-endopeptidase MepM/ murein hydrolase activator NlpD
MERLARNTVILIILAVTLFLVAMIWISVHQDGAAPSAAEIDAALGNQSEAIGLPSGLLIPVADVRAAQLGDTFSEARAGGRRVHDAIDIMALRGTPVIAAAAGTVEKLYFSNGGGGITIYVRSIDGSWMYYYAHLDGYAPGLHEGQRISQGDVIGRVGFTGNASAAGPHLHFAILRMAPNERWWQGRAINPYPLLAGRRSPR